MVVNGRKWVVDGRKWVVDGRKWVVDGRKWVVVLFQQTQNTRPNHSYLFELSTMLTFDPFSSNN